MTKDTTVAETANAGGVKADWSALKDFSEVVVEPAKPAPVIEEKTNELKVEETKPEVKTEEVKPEVKTESTPEEKLKLETEALSKEAKELGLAETATKEEVEAAKTAKESGEIQFKVDEIANVPQTYEDGTFGALAHDLFGVELKDESPEAFKEAFVPRAEFEKIQNITLDSVLASVKPEVATALKLIEAGIPAEQVLQPTKELDQYLSLDDATLVRTDLELQGDLTPAIIDDMMEKLAESPDKLKLEADKLRIFVNRQINQIVEERKQYLQKYEADKQNALLQQKEQSKTQITNAMNNVSEFMGVKVSKEIKDAIIRKYNNGLYDNDLNSPASKVEFLLQKELGNQLAKHIKNKASSDAKTEVRKQLLNTPPVITGAGQKVDDSKQPNDNIWGALKDFKT